MDIIKFEIFEDLFQVRYDDGSRESIDGGIYERKNSDNDTVEQRLATAADVARLTALAETYEQDIKPLDAVVIQVQIVGAHIDIYYDDGRKETIQDGIYEIKDANNDTIFERTATDDDTARLLSLDVGETGAGTPSGSGPFVFDGTAGDDDIDGTEAADVINGLDGDDRLRGRGGDDEVNGGTGNDRVRGDAGVDTVSGGDGDDRLRGGLGDDTVSGDAGNDRVRGNGGDDVVTGGAGDDRVKGDAGNDIVSGGDGADIVKGNLGNDVVTGDAGNDVVNGDEGNDTVSGGDGDDRVKGGSGDDVVNGDAGSDVYDGGLGADTFVFGVDGAFDRIKDFEDGSDVIDISAFGVADAVSLDMTQVRLNVLIDLGGGDVIRVDNVTVDQLSDADFIF